MSGHYEEILECLVNRPVNLKLVHNDKIRDALKYVAIISDYTHNPSITEPLEGLLTTLLDLDQDLENAYYEAIEEYPED